MCVCIKPYIKKEDFRMVRETKPELTETENPGRRELRRRKKKRKKKEERPERNCVAYLYTSNQHPLYINVPAVNTQGKTTL